MGLIDKINWRSPVNVLALFCVLAGVFFTAFATYQWFKPDPPPPVTVSLTPEQARAIYEPVIEKYKTFYDSNAKERRRELKEALLENRQVDSAYHSFQNQQQIRDEKYHSAGTAAPSVLLRELSDRYDR